MKPGKSRPNAPSATGASASWLPRARDQPTASQGGPPDSSSAESKKLRPRLPGQLPLQLSSGRQGPQPPTDLLQLRGKALQFSLALLSISRQQLAPIPINTRSGHRVSHSPATASSSSTLAGDSRRRGRRFRSVRCRGSGGGRAEAAETGPVVMAATEAEAEGMAAAATTAEDQASCAAAAQPRRRH